MKKLIAILSLAMVTFLSPQFVGADVLDVGPQTATFTGNTRGYWFTAPVDFVITGARVADDASIDNQDIEILMLDSAPPSWPTTSNAFTSVFRITDVPGSGFVSTGNINVSAGDIIGVLGSRGPTSTNSYGDGDYMSSIFGNPVSLQRFGMQFDLRSTAAQDVWAEPGGFISRVELEFQRVPEPGSIAILGLASTVLMVRRRKS
ncbi:MAG: PEP-CTERM sorting domain-containing protein [Planctomycetota bacterium]